MRFDGQLGLAKRHEARLDVSEIGNVNGEWAIKSRFTFKDLDGRGATVHTRGAMRDEAHSFTGKKQFKAPDGDALSFSAQPVEPDESIGQNVIAPGRRVNFR